LAEVGAQPCLVTCDHVVKAYSGSPDWGPTKLFDGPVGIGRQCGTYEGLSLSGPGMHVADVAVAPLIEAPDHPGQVPTGGPAAQLTGLASPSAGDRVYLWSGHHGVYLPGNVVRMPSQEMLPHRRYFPNGVLFDLQFGVGLDDPTRLPALGDSGGPFVRGDGALVGLFQAKWSSAAPQVGGPVCHVFGAPLLLAFQRLGAIMML
jgi:hypothetical protein